MSDSVFIPEDKIEFQYTTSLNNRKVKNVLRVYINQYYLRPGIDSLGLENGSYTQLVSELQVNWSGAIGLVKQKAFNKGGKHEDHSMIQAVGNQLFAAFEQHEEDFPSEDDDELDRKIESHVHYLAAFFVNAVWEIQHDQERILSVLLLSDKIERVDTRSAHAPKPNESPSAYHIRSLEADLKMGRDERKKLVAQNHQYKSDVETMGQLRSNNLELLKKLEAAEAKINNHAAEKAAMQELHEMQMTGQRREKTRMGRWFSAKVDKLWDEKEALKAEIEALEAEKAQTKREADAAYFKNKQTELDLAFKISEIDMARSRLEALLGTYCERLVAEK